MKKFEIRKNRIEVPWAHRKKIKEGVTLTGSEHGSEIVKDFDTLKEAQTDLQKYKSSIVELSNVAGKYYLVEEFYIEENSYDKEGEWEDGGDVWEFSKITIELVEKPSYETLATFDNMEEAESARDAYVGGKEVYLCF